MENGIYKIGFRTRKEFDENGGSHEHFLVVHMKDGKKDGCAMFFHDGGTRWSMPDSFRDDRFVPPSSFMTEFESYWGERESEDTPELIMADSDLDAFADFVKSGTRGAGLNVANILLPAIVQRHIRMNDAKGAM